MDFIGYINEMISIIAMFIFLSYGGRYLLVYENNSYLHISGCK